MMDLSPFDYEELKTGVEALYELKKTREKFPPFNSAHEGWAVIHEELDELWDQVRLNQNANGRNAFMRKEAIQVAAMALRFVIDLPNFKN